MKRFFIFLFFVVISMRALYAGYFCRPDLMNTARLITGTYLASVGIYNGVNVLNQQPFIYTNIAGSNWKDNHTKVLIQGFCTSNERSAPIEFTDITMPRQDTTGEIPLVCWCQMIMPYVSKVVASTLVFSTSSVQNVEQCMAKCTAQCKMDFTDIGTSYRTGFLMPSEKIYVVGGE